MVSELASPPLTTERLRGLGAQLQAQIRGQPEALHIVCEVAKSNPGNKELQETIGEQKIILENIMLLLSFYKESDPNMASLLTDMEQLKKSFDKVNITYTYKESTFEVVDGVMVIKDNSSSTIDITPKDVEDISSITQNIRTKIIS